MPLWSGFVFDIQNVLLEAVAGRLGFRPASVKATTCEVDATPPLPPVDSVHAPHRLLQAAAVHCRAALPSPSRVARRRLKDVLLLLALFAGCAPLSLAYPDVR